MKKVKIIILILAIAAALIAVYLNRAYAHIYSKFELIKPPITQDYMTEKTLTEKSQLLTYVAIGDSLTAGVGANSVSSSLPALLAEKLSAKKRMEVNVKNLGVPGATSFDLLTGQVLDAAKYKPDIITLFIGTNDIHNFVPIEKFKSNLVTAINGLKQTTKAEIYLINIPYLGAKDLLLPPYDLYFDLKVKDYNKAVAEAASETGVTLVDLYSESAATFKTDGAMYSIDRFHPSDAGYVLWSEIIYGYLK